ncbi:hypothetical protein AgCh_014547 [Apium graveolens]
MVLKAAIELDLLEIIAKAGPDAYVTPNEVASMLPTSNLDAPIMIDRILRVLASYSILKCVEHVGGDMFASVPTGDAIFLKWICHNWSDEQCLKLLMNCYQALAEHGKVIIADSILPEHPGNENATRTAIHFDAIMLAHIPGGRERTEK